jgi:hypothetical protein
MRRNEAGRKDDSTPELENQRATIIKDIHYGIITRRNLDCKVALASVGCEINNNKNDNNNNLFVGFMQNRL